MYQVSCGAGVSVSVYGYLRVVVYILILLHKQMEASV